MKSNYENRFVAYIIDYSIFLALAFFTVIHFGLPITGIFSWFDTAQVLAFAYLSLYKMICYTIFHGITIGGFILNVRIVNHDLKRLSLRTAFIRALMHSLLPIAIINVGYMLLNRTQQTIFDVATKTTSINIFQQE